MFCSMVCEVSWANRKVSKMSDNQRKIWRYGVAFWVIFICGPFVGWAIPEIPFVRSAVNSSSTYSYAVLSIYFFGWPLVLSVLLHLRLFHGFKNVGIGNIWLPLLISHIFILPGVFGWLIVILLGGKIPFSGEMALFYVPWFIVSLAASFWLPRTKPFAGLNIAGNHSRDFALTGLIFSPVIMNVAVGYIGLII